MEVLTCTSQDERFGAGQEGEAKGETHEDAHIQSEEGRVVNSPIETFRHVSMQEPLAVRTPQSRRGEGGQGGGEVSWLPGASQLRKLGRSGLLTASPQQIPGGGKMTKTRRTQGRRPFFDRVETTEDTSWATRATREGVEFRRGHEVQPFSFLFAFLFFLSGGGRLLLEGCGLSFGGLPDPRRCLQAPESQCFGRLAV